MHVASHAAPVDGHGLGLLQAVGPNKLAQRRVKVAAVLFSGPLRNKKEWMR
jgi:hypothetical protein